MSEKQDSSPIVQGPIDLMRKRLEGVKTRVEIGTHKTKVLSKYKYPAQTEQKKEATMKNCESALIALGRLEKQAFVPGSEVGGAVDPATGLPVDPATGMPMDPATGMPIDPATGMPVDPAAMGGAPPGMDPAAGGMPPPPMDPAMAGGMPPDPAMMGAPPPMDPAMAPPPVAAEASAEGPAPATMDDVAVVEERVTAVESMMKELIDLVDSLGANKEGEAAEAEAAAAAAPEAEAGGVPGPLGGGGADALSQLSYGGSPDSMNRVLGKLQQVGPQ
jgi:hypothetical protein